MARPVTIFTGQWADLSMEEMCRTAKEMGYEGLEIASWGQIDVEKAAEDLNYVKELKGRLDEGCVDMDDQEALFEQAEGPGDDDAAVERFNISVGQIYYFTESRTGDDNITWENDDKTGSLVWAGDTYWRISERWGLRGGIQYDTRLDNVATSNSSIEYRRDEDRLVQLNYRYASPEYIQATLPKYYSTAEQYKNGISQVGAVASWPIADRWSIVGAYYYDTNANKQADSMLGVQYSSCCYAIRVGYERKLNGWDNDKQHAVYDNAIGFNIELRGLSSNYGLGTQEMLRSNILPYQKNLFPYQSL